jgi:Protein of unknown function (DUF2948)
MAERRLLLLAESDEDLQVISALTQDMAVRAADVAWQAKPRRLVLIGNRYRWETREKTRVRSGLRFDGVLSARRRNWPGGDAVLALLAIRKDGDHLLLDFAGGASIELHVEAVDVVLEDLTGAWGAKTAPDHG